MHPSIMWNRNFYYSLASMPPQEQEIIHQWYLEMNDKQKFYIKEIERANDQLKETAAKLFVKKGFTKEYTDLFLKKVNFMENREYFFHKRNLMIEKILIQKKRATAPMIKKIFLKIKKKS